MRSKLLFAMKILARVAVFFAILFAILFALSGITNWVTSQEGKTDRHMRDYIYTYLGEQKKNSIDVFVGGDSETMASFSPIQAFEEEGIASFPLVMPAARLSELVPMIQMSMENQSPKVLLLETNLLYQKIEPAVGFKVLMESKISNRLMVFRLHNVWKHAFSPLPKQYKLWRGFRLRDGVAPAVKVDEYMKQPADEKRPIAWMNRQLFNMILRTCRKNHVRLILYSCPSTTNYGMRKHNSLQELADENGLTYIDLNLAADEIGIDWNADTFDQGDHLNLAGARKVTSYLVRDVKQLMPDLPDHRNDPEYADWLTDAAEYDKAVEEVLGLIEDEAAAGGGDAVYEQGDIWSDWDKEIH